MINHTYYTDKFFTNKMEKPQISFETLINTK